MRQPDRSTGAVLLLSLLFHASLGVAVALVPRRSEKKTVVVTLRQTPRPPAKPATPAAPATPAPATPSVTPAPVPALPARTQRRPARAATPRAAVAAPAPSATPAIAAGAADFGLTLSGSAGAGNLAVPAGGGGGGGGGGGIQGTASVPEVHPGCTEPLVRARAIEVPQPVYPESKREAGTEGRVRVEIRVDATGAVTEARVLQSLSPEFDAAALEAARQGRFASATRCGEPVASTFVISIRFQL